MINFRDVYRKEKITDNYINIANNSTTHISSVKFLDLDRIIIYVDYYNIFKNTNVKNILLYKKELNELIQLDNNAEIENIVASGIQEQKHFRSHYNMMLSDHLITNGLVMISEKEEKLILENNKYNSEIRALEDKILFNNNLNQKNEFLMFFDKLLVILTKSEFTYRLIDILYFYFISNNKRMFDFLVNI